MELRFEVAREVAPGPRPILCLRCLNDDLERLPVSAVSLEASGISGLEALDSCSPVDLAPGQGIHRRFRLPENFAEDRAVFDLRYQDRDRNRRLVRRRYVTHDGSARR